MTTAGWNSLVALDPRLADLKQATVLDEARLPDDFCANLFWSREVKPRLVQLVGWNRPRMGLADEDRLRSQYAYDTATWFLYDQLPSCRNCGCIRWPGRPSVA